MRIADTIARDLRLSRPTARKALKTLAESAYQRQPAPKLGGFTAHLSDFRLFPRIFTPLCKRGAGGLNAGPFTLAGNKSPLTPLSKGGNGLSVWHKHFRNSP